MRNMDDERKSGLGAVLAAATLGLATIATVANLTAWLARNAPHAVTGHPGVDAAIQGGLIVAPSATMLAAAIAVTLRMQR